MLYFRRIMVGACHTPESSSVSDEVIRRLIHEEVAAAIRAEIPEMFGSIKTTLIETFNERYIESGLCIIEYLGLGILGGGLGVYTDAVWMVVLGLYY